MPEPICKFHDVFDAEIATINERRTLFERPRVELETEDYNEDGTPILRPNANSHLVGLALSGGGIRSAAFCLGALQALDVAKCAPDEPAGNYVGKIDYLSTVSGGGYIGASLTAAMSVTNTPQFPFPSELRQNESPALQHIRDHSNYLFPRGVLNVFYNVVIYLRGIVANLIQVLWFLLLFAILTIVIKPTVASLDASSVAGFEPPFLAARGHFAVTLTAILIFTGALAVWALWRSLDTSGWAGELTSKWRMVFAGLLIVVVVAIFCEIQPVVLGGMFQLEKWESGGYANVAAALKWLAGIIGTFATAVGFLSRSLAAVLKRGAEKPGIGALLKRAMATLAIYIAGLAVPLLLWVGYLYLSLWGIQDTSVIPPIYHAPDWVMEGAQWIGGAHASPIFLYVPVALVLFLLALVLAPNANSLHRLYRDRLSKAFLIHPLKREAGDAAADTRSLDLAPLDQLKLSQIVCRCAPYHLINAALNIQGSKYANRRGRNADFFLFSPKFTGSAATGYVATATVEATVKELDVATAMAISGAAASSNMGRATIGPLAPTLAMLNIRLGFWLTNPSRIAHQKARAAKLLDKFYFLCEAFGYLREDSGTIYLTDGGHIENLGIYELLRRRCRLIIAVDAEADPDMAFNSLVALQRFARIDLGVRIDLPWAAIRDASRAAHGRIAKTGGDTASEAPRGPHCALGEISYPKGGTGYLLYVKSSLSGDESDYVVDYCRRYPDFPHETTADQFFTEEQFEVYRALGFHALQGALSGRDIVAMRTVPPDWLKNVL